MAEGSPFPSLDDYREVFAYVLDNGPFRMMGMQACGPEALEFPSPLQAMPRGSVREYTGVYELRRILDNWFEKVYALSNSLFLEPDAGTREWTSRALRNAERFNEELDRMFLQLGVNFQLQRERPYPRNNVYNPALAKFWEIHRASYARAASGQEAPSTPQEAPRQAGAPSSSSAGSAGAPSSGPKAGGASATHPAPTPGQGASAGAKAAGAPSPGGPKPTPPSCSSGSMGELHAWGGEAPSTEKTNVYEGHSPGLLRASTTGETIGEVGPTNVETTAKDQEPSS